MVGHRHTAVGGEPRRKCHRLLRGGQADGERGGSAATSTMEGTAKRLSAAVKAYAKDVRRVRASGGATAKRSIYGPLSTLLNAIGSALAPRVFCAGELADQGAGHPDFGLYAEQRVQTGKPRKGQIPERGVVEVKALSDDTWLTEEFEQVSRY